MNSKIIYLLLYFTLFSQAFAGGGDYIFANSFQEKCTGNAGDLSNIPANSAFIVNCDYKLDSTEIALAENVELIYEGGTIENGEVGFSLNGLIDPELLNHTLTVVGDVSLNHPVFNFRKNRWHIVEGSVDDDDALANRVNFQHIINLVSDLNGNIFKVISLDAFFKVGGFGPANVTQHFSINLPSNFEFNMSPSTHLRVQPTNDPFLKLIQVYERQNVRISGGNLYGDREEHDYSPVFDPFGTPRHTHEWPGLIVVQGSKDIEIDGVYMANSTGDAFIAGAAAGFRTDPENPFNDRVVLKNSIIDGARRNGISITDGSNIVIENNIIKNTGLGEPLIDEETGDVIISSAGVAPRFGIDVEPFIGYNDDGSRIFFEKVETVFIRNNEFRNNKAGSVIDYSGIDVTIEGNYAERGLYANFGTGTKFLNNTLVANESEGVLAVTGITPPSRIVNINGEPVEFSRDSEIRNNYISGFIFGMDIKGRDILITDNEITKFRTAGIKFSNSPENITLIDNVLSNPDTADDTYRDTIGVQGTTGVAKGITFDNISIKVPRRPLQFIDHNNHNLENEFKTKFINSRFESLQNYDVDVFRSIGLQFFSNHFINSTINAVDSDVEESDNIFD